VNVFILIAHKIIITLPLIIGLFGGEAIASESDTSIVYYSTNEFEVTEFDRKMYLRNAPPEAGGGIGSRARNLQALSDLYALEILYRDATKGTSLSQRERDWLANYAIKLELIRRYLKSEVTGKINTTDWTAEARERYLSAPEDYQKPEMVSVRTLLIKSEDRSEEEALLIASDLLRQAEQPDTDFAQLVAEHTEDEAALENEGLMLNVKRGQTVAPFEAAAFEMRESGQLSEPVVSQFGVHLIQLVEYVPFKQLSFEEVEQYIIDELRPVRTNQYRSGLQNEARERKPVGFVEHTGALDALMERTSNGPLGPRFPLGENEDDF